MFQTWDNSQLLRRVLWISTELTIVSSLKHKNTQPIYIFNRENPQNSETQNGPRRGGGFQSTSLRTWFHSFEKFKALQKWDFHLHFEALKGAFFSQFHDAVPIKEIKWEEGSMGVANKKTSLLNFSAHHMIDVAVTTRLGNSEKMQARSCFLSG